MRKKHSRLPANLARFAVAAGLLALVFSRIDRGALFDVLRQAGSRCEWLLAAVALYGLIAAIGILRWQLLLRGQAIFLPLRRVAAIFFTGLFFNSFLFGSTGGDLARLFYAARAAPTRKTESAVTIVADRLIGMFAMLILAAIVILARWRVLQAEMGTRLAAGAVLAMTAFLPAAALLIVVLHRFRGVPALAWAIARFTRAPFMRRLFAAVIEYRQHPRYLAVAFALSLAGHMITICISAIIGYALGISLGFLEYLTGVPLVLTLASLPITPAGLGLRESLAVTILGAFGVDEPHALSLSLTIFAVALAWSLMGGLIFLINIFAPGRSFREQMREIQNESDVP